MYSLDKYYSQCLSHNNNIYDADKVNIESSMKSQSNTLIKYHTFLSYLMEFGYDLGIAPSYNVSGSFGFESFIGIMK